MEQTLLILIEALAKQVC